MRVYSIRIATKLCLCVCVCIAIWYRVESSSYMLNLDVVVVKEPRTEIHKQQNDSNDGQM